MRYFGGLAIRERRTHGFASRPRDRFAFIGCAAPNQEKVKQKC
jgi:hypothetical protein